MKSELQTTGTPGELITLADGIDTVAGKFAKRYAPYHTRLAGAWSVWQATVRPLGVPEEYKGRVYRFPSKDILVDASDDDGNVTETMARVTIKGTLRHVRHAQRAMRVLQRCQANQITLLPAAVATLWSTIEQETAGYAMNIKPLTPNVYREREFVQRPSAPTRMEWMKGIDEDGPDILRFYELRALEDTSNIYSLIDLLQPDHRYPGGDGLRATGSTEAGIQL